MPLKIGHRGAPKRLPENTISSFRNAIDLGADGIELDLHLSKDGELAVIHDDTVDRTTDGKGKVADFTLAELRKLRMEGGEHVPMLAEVLEALGRDAHYFIEVKVAEAALPTARLVQEYIARGWDAEKLCLISFQHGGLREVAKQFPVLYTGASFVDIGPGQVEKAKSDGMRAIIPNYKRLTAEQVKQAHDLGLGVIAWTVNDAEDIARVAGIGVNGIISDFPERL